MKKYFAILFVILVTITLLSGCINRPTDPPSPTGTLPIPNITNITPITPSATTSSPNNISSETPINTVTPTSPINTFVPGNSDEVRYEFDPNTVTGLTYVLPTYVWVGGYHWITPTGILLNSLKRVTSIVNPVDNLVYKMNESDWIYDGYYHPLGTEADKYIVVNNGGTEENQYSIKAGLPGFPSLIFAPLPPEYYNWITISGNGDYFWTTPTGHTLRSLKRVQTITDPADNQVYTMNEFDWIYCATIKPKTSQKVDIAFIIPENLSDEQAKFVYILKAGQDELANLAKNNKSDSDEGKLLAYINQNVSVTNITLLKDNPNSSKILSNLIKNNYIAQKNAKKDNFEFWIKSKTLNSGWIAVEECSKWEIVMSPGE